MQGYQQQQLQQMMSTPVPYTPPQTNVSATPSSTATTPLNNTNNNPAAAPTNPVTGGQAPATNIITPPASTEPETTDFSTYAPAAPTGTTAPAQQPQVYTGFGAGNQGSAPSSPAPSPNTGSSGGWNIKY
jgi:hypothetical protein